MEVATATPTSGNVPPFHDHDVREWSTLDNLTGVLERTRIETDHWAANTNNSSHKYGKVVDSRARTDADGALRQQARRQLEVFQSQVPGGQLQVIKTHSVSSSHWSNKKVENTISNGIGKEFEGLEIPSNPLDLSFQKSKALIGRSAARRPPTRLKNKDDSSPTRQNNHFTNPHLTASENLQKVTRLCHQIHENALKQAFGKYTNNSAISERLNLTKPTENTIKTNLSRTKSSSSEDFLINLKNDKTAKSIEDLEDLEQLQTWRRTSKIRRSLQHAKQDRSVPKPIDLPENSVSVRKITEDFEKGRRLSTALRGNSVDLQALDQILQSISSSSSDKTEDDLIFPNVNKSKRDSFVTVESLKEIKDKLRRTSSPDKDTDDGIVTEDNTLTKSEEAIMIESNNKITSQSKVKSYVYGMESNLNKKPVIGTGSLESRSKLLNGTTNRSEDWYNRRKSYGFEPVQNPNETMSSKKNLVESSTDSGICRSSEVIIVPSVIKNNNRYLENDNDDDDSSDNVDVKNKLLNESSFGNVKKISSLFDNAPSKSNHFGVKKDENYTWKKGANKDNNWKLNSGITIKIPIVSNNQWNDESERETKRHSIAVDETKYVLQNKKDVNETRRTSLIISNDINNDDFSAFGKKSKRVEFCKTEVHFAAESGKVNIVETDEKPPPTQNFRRRRRNSNSLNYLNECNKNGFPLLHFGENYAEKPLFSNGNTYYSEDDTESDNGIKKIISQGIVTVNSDSNYLNMFEDDKREFTENENRKGILKNKIIKPKPYHLGEYPMSFNIFDEEHQNLHNLENDLTPLWKSTITVSNTLYDNTSEEISKNFDPNNQPDLIKDQLKRLTNELPEKPKPFLTVAERIRNMEEHQKMENYKGYSTRVNIGDGQAIVVENKPDIFMEPSKTEAKDDTFSNQSKVINYPDEPVKIKAEIKNRKYSPIVLRKYTPSPLVKTNSNQLKSEILSSPSLVGTKMKEEFKETFNSIENDKKIVIEENAIKNEKVLRQPKKSEMAYFGIKLEKDVVTNQSKEAIITNSKNEKNSNSPIYENISVSNLTKTESIKPVREFDACILDELTKAADEILQAVKDYSEEESKKQNREKEELKSELTTITENKSWKHQEKAGKPINRPCKSKLSNASSNSSLEASPKDTNNVKPSHRYISNTKASADKIRTKTTSNNENSIHKAQTKARRLQRASSREALLQSHGSSSEDLAANEVPLRKPRLIRKTKTNQLTINNGLDVSISRGTASTNAKKKTEISKTKPEERLPGALPEIRHKTAISTIRSTAEKSERSTTKLKGEDVKKKTPQYKDIMKVSSLPANPIRNKRETVTHRLATANIKKYRPDKR